MRETFSNYLSKMVENTKDLLTYPSAEQTTQDQETAASSLQGKRAASQSEKDGSTLLAVKNSKKRRIPFVALALVLLFASFCVISAFGLRPVALAHKLTAFDDTPTPASVPPDQSVSFLVSEGNGVLAKPTTCSATNTYESVVSKDTLCWDQDGFTFGDRDITCIVNPQYSAHPSPLNTTITLGFTVQASLSLALPAATSLNQNTCTDNSQCVSDNSSYTDFATPGVIYIHNEVDGDDILCANNACTNANTGSTTECGDPAGQQMNYDRFGCQMVDTTFHAEGPGSRANHWKVTGAAINPTSYDPNGALYLPTINLTETAHNTIDAGSTNTYPSCETGNRWICPNADGGKTPAVVVYQNEGNFTADKKGSKNLQVSTPNNTPIPIFYVVCDTTGAGWAFPCSDQGTKSNITAADVNAHVPQSLDNGTVTETIIKEDWLSGDTQGDTPLPDGVKNTGLLPALSGHLEYTYLNDTVNQPGVQVLEPYTLAIGGFLIIPSLVLIGYQFIWAAWTFGHANAMESFGRIILSGAAVIISFQVAAMLISLADSFNLGVVGLHANLGYPHVTIDGQTSTFTLDTQGETDAASFRGVVVPISRWGCIANDFVVLLADKFWTDASGFIPFVGGIIKFGASINNAIDAAKHIGEFAVLILSIALCTQVFIRILLLNYYVLTAPLAFGCWGLPGGVGQKVVSSWAKGFCALLFTQTIQLFVLTTFPLILPDFPALPTDKFHILGTIFDALPRILVLVAVAYVPKLLGTKATQAIAQAGTVAGGAIVAGGGMAMNVV